MLFLRKMKILNFYRKGYYYDEEYLVKVGIRQNNLWENPLAEDLDHILIHTEGLWEEIRENVFHYWRHRFFGCWLQESFAWANNNLNLNASALVLTRNYDAFQRRCRTLLTTRQSNSILEMSGISIFPKGNFRTSFTPPPHRPLPHLTMKTLSEVRYRCRRHKTYP